MARDTSDAPSEFEFRPLREEDLPLMRDWLNRSHLQRWWRAGKVTLHYVREHYLPRIDGTDATRPFLAHVGDDPVGYVQVYHADENPEWWPDSPGRGARGVDLFLGDPDGLGQGVGTRMLSAFVDLVLQNPDITEIRVDPHPANLRAIRCYEKAGFESRGHIVTPDGPAVLMVFERP